MPLKRRASEIAAISVACAMVATMAGLLGGADGLLLANGQPVFGDFIAFWSAGRAVLDGHGAEVHNPALIYAYHQAAIPGIAFVAPWNSPPTFLLIASPLALLPYPLAALVFLAGSGALYLHAARKLLPDGRALVFALTMPAALYHLGSVQTGLLMAGLSGLALHWLDKRPRAAGALVGLLAIKPHLAILWPLLLALSGRWRAFAAATASMLAIVLLAGFVFGFDSYLRFLGAIAATQDLVTDQRLATPAYASLYGNLLGLGASHFIAGGAHLLSASAALLWATLLFRRSDRATQAAALCAATLLVTPYLFFYDITLLGIGAAMLGAPRDRFETAALAFAWSAGLSLALGYLAPLPLCSLAAWLVLIAAIRRAGSAAPRPAPAPHM
jgi:hypothetical protein